MNLSLRLLFILLVSTAVSGCIFPTSDLNLPTPLATEYIPTAIALTVEAQKTKLAPTNQPTVTYTATLEALSKQETENTPLPTSTFTQTTTTSVPDQATLISAPTPTPPPEVPYGTIQILNPGPASRVSSPFLLKAYLLPGEKGRVQIELLGEDGRVLMRDLKVYQAPFGARVTIAMEISYEISAVAEAGRIQISVMDKYGRTSALASTNVILLSMGESDQNPAGDNLESIAIQEPKPNALIQGGTVRVAGLARTRSDQPLVIELKTNEGKIVGTRQVGVEAPEEGQYGAFAIDVPYIVSAPTKVRLSVWERSEHVPGIVHLSSLEVLLSP